MVRISTLCKSWYSFFNKMTKRKANVIGIQGNLGFFLTTIYGIFGFGSVSLTELLEIICVIDNNFLLCRDLNFKNLYKVHT